MLLPEHLETPGITTGCQVAPPSFDQLATRPQAPPSLQRSCWYMPTMFDEFVGFTSARGSGSAFGKSTLPSTDSWSPTLSAVQPANGVGPEAKAVDVRVYGPADAVLASTSAATPAAARVAKRMSPPSLGGTREFKTSAA